MVDFGRQGESYGNRYSQVPDLQYCVQNIVYTRSSCSRGSEKVSGHQNSSTSLEHTHLSTRRTPERFFKLDQVQAPTQIPPLDLVSMCEYSKYIEREMDSMTDQTSDSGQSTMGQSPSYSIILFETKIPFPTSRFL